MIPTARFFLDVLTLKLALDYAGMAIAAVLWAAWRLRPSTMKKAPE
jgi:hypothetical protein